MLVITYRFPFMSNLGKYVVLLTFWISLMLMPAFHLVRPLGGESIFGYTMTSVDYERLLSFSYKVLIISCLSWYFFSLFQGKKRKVVYEYHPKQMSQTQVYSWFALMFICSGLCLVLGIGKMGSMDSVILPFHLNGILVLAKMILFPKVFAIIVENIILCKKKVPRLYYLLFGAWAILEVFTRLSKSAIMNAFLTVAIVLFLYYRPNIKSIIRIGAPIILAFLLLYPTVELMRSSGESNLTESFNSSVKQSNKSIEDMILPPLNRTFMIPSYYAKDYPWVNHEQLFDFSKAPLLMTIGGAARYQTFVIDGFPDDSVNSSGTTGLQDPLLFGGYGLCFIVIVLLVALAFLVDSLIEKRMISMYVMLFLMLWSFCNYQNITSFTDSLGLQYFAMRIAAIWMAFQLNFKRKVVKC